MKSILKNRFRRKLSQLMLYGCGLIAFASCSKVLPDAPGKATTPVYQISLVSGNSQTGTAGNNLAYALVAMVTDTSTGTAVSGVPVEWSVLSGGGNLNNVYSTSSRTGLVSASYTLGSGIGTNTAQVNLKGATSSLVSYTESAVAGGPSALHSSIVGSSPVENDGVNTSAITITLKDANNNAVVGRIPTFTATGTSNIQTACTSSNASGVSTCTLASHTAETKVLSITNPTIVGGTVVFAPGPVATVNSSISVAAGPTTANGTATVLVTITLKDSSNVGVGGTAPTFSATDTGVGNTYGTCSVTNSSGVSTCTLASTVAESKTVSLTSPVSTAGNSTIFVPGAANNANSLITGTSPVEPDGSSSSTISVTLQDANHNTISGVTPTFSATDTGASNVYGSCSASVAGASTCHLSSTTAEVKTLSLTSPISKIGGTVTFAPSAAVAANSNIVGTSPVIADGTAVSTVTITLKDSNHVAVTGVVPTFIATNTGSGNSYGTCSSTNASGVSTCTFTSTVAETKTLSLASPITFTGGSVVFNPGPISQATSTITGTGPVIADGSATSTITLHLLDAQSNGISGVTPTFSATDTGTTNVQGTCSVSNASGTSTCLLSSTKAEVKTLSVVTPGAVVGGTVSFIAGSANIANSSIVGTGPVSPDGTSTSSISITLQDAFHNPVTGSVPTFSATDSGATNVYGTCSAGNAGGLSTCTLSSTHPETKVLSLTAPLSMTGGSVVFAPGSASSTHSSITGTGSVTADGTSSSTVTITLKDANNIAIPGTVPTFSATDSGAGNVYGSCTASSASGVSTCTFTSTKAEIKTLSIVSPLSTSGGTVTFTAGIVSGANCQITGTGPVVSNGTASSTVTIVLYDANNNPIAGAAPTFSATDTGGGNIYSTCTATTASGASTCTLKSTKAETKTLSIVSPVLHAGGTVSFTAQAAVAANSTITGSGPVAADGAAASTVTITLEDVNQNPVPGVVPTFSATNTGNGNTQGTCSTTNASGVSTCSLTSTRAETKALSILAPVSVAGGSVIFNAATASATTSTITGSGPVNADGTAVSTITVTLKDINSNPIIGTTPTFSATDTGSTNVQTACGASNASGVSTCTLKATHAEVKTLSLITPVAFAGGTVTFTAVAASAYTTITGTSSIVANGVATSSVTITLKDYSNTGISGVVPTFSATDTGATNGYGICSSSDASGVSTCTLKSTKAEVKTLTLATPISKTGGTVTFIPGSASSSTTTLTGTGPVAADGTSTSTVTITLLDSYSNPVSGTVPVFLATNTGTTNVYGTCSSSSASGVSTCTLKSSKGETKTLSLSSPIAMTGGTVSFTQTVSLANTTISATASALADGTSIATISISLKDYANGGVSGVVPTFTATNTGSHNTVTACTTSNGSGNSTCTLKSTQAETKTITLATPVSKSGGTVSFTQAASSTYTTITGTTPTLADGSAYSTVTITLKDYTNAVIVGTVPTFSAGGSTNTYGTCSSTDASGVSTCTLRSTVGESKTLSLSSPISFSGGAVLFTQTAYATNSNITGSGPVDADGVSTSTITITLKDYANAAVVGTTPTFTATNTGSGNTYGTCSSSNSSGVSTCTLKSTRAETKTLSLASPVTLSGGSVVFNPLASASNSSITGSGPVSANGSSTSTITITLRDYANAAIVGTTPNFSATNTGSGNTYGGCSSTNSSGISTCTLTSTNAETKALSITSPITVNGGSVVFNQAASASYSTISGTDGTTISGTASVITITLKDYANTAIAGVVPTYSTTTTAGGGTSSPGLTKPACTSSSASGVSTCQLTSSTNETVYIGIATPTVVTGGSVDFTSF